MEQKEKLEITPVEPSVEHSTYYNYKKSNVLISASYKSTLTENKLLAMGLHTAATGHAHITKEGYVVSRMEHAEIKKLLNTSSNNLYKVLSEAAQALINRPIYMEDKDAHNFKYINAVVDAEYINGVFQIRFHKDLKPLLIDQKEAFTPLNLETITKFKSVYAMKLYELLKSKAYDPKNIQNPRSGTFKLRFTLAELKINIGTINTNMQKVQNVLKNSLNPDYEKAVSVAEEGISSFDTWDRFKNRVLSDKVMKEIDELTEMTVTYDTVSGGRGGKIQAIIFTVTYKDRPGMNKEERKKELTDEEKDNVLEEMEAIISTPLKIRDLRKIAEAADYEIGKISKAADVYNTYIEHHTVDNVVGYFISAIKGNYEVVQEEKKKKTSAGKKSKQVPNQFNMFDQRDYDFDELEKMLLEK